MRSTDLTIDDVKQISINIEPREILIDGKEVDLSRTMSLRVDFDYRGMEILLCFSGGEIPFK